MPTTVQFRRGTAAQNDSFTGNAGEISYDTTNLTIRVHDGSNAGGSRLATFSEVADRLQVANAVATYSTLTQLGNTNSYIAAESARIDLVNTNLTSTNTAIRALVSDRLQVANADATFVTKATALTSNNALLNLINDRMQVANVSSLVSTEVSNLVDSAPETLNTLNELAAALGDDANFATTTATSLGTKASNTYVNTTFVTKATAVSSNNALKTLIDDRLQVANATATFSTLTQLGNTNSYIATESARIDLVNTNLTSTNTAIRTLVNDRLQVANAAATYVTKSTAVTSNNALKTLINDRLQVANATATFSTLTQLGNTNAYIASVQSNLNATNANVDQKLGATATVTLTGDVSGSASFSSNSVSITTTVADDSHNHIISNIDGLQNELNSKIQVANAAATFSTLVQLGNTNAYIASVQSNLDATNTNVDQKLGATASVTLTGDVSGTASFSANAVSITTTVANDSHNHSSSSGNFTVGGDLTVSGGDITLSGTGRIQGIDTVTAGTDAANKTYVDNAVAGVVDSAPEALNTLNELAAALGDDANFATTTATTLGTKASNTYVNSTFSTLAQLANTNAYIATKQDTITGGATTITSSNLTASRALVSDGSGKVSVSAVTSTELGYLDGVTSAIQTQLGTKISTTDARVEFLQSANTSITNDASSITTTQSNVDLSDQALVNPAGFITLNIGGVNYKLPFFS